MDSRKTFRFIKSTGRMGFFAFLSAITSPASATRASRNTTRKIPESQPMF